MTEMQLYIKLNHLSPDLKLEVSDFIDFLLIKQNKNKGKKVPQFGCAKGQIYMTPDFDLPLDDFKEYMK